MTEAANNPQSSAGAECPVCGAPQRRGDTRCWLCGAIAEYRAAREDFADEGTRQLPSAPQRGAVGAEARPIGVGAAPSASFTPGRRSPVAPVGGFSLASLMMFVTLASVVLGTITIAPGLGVPLGIVALFTWLRTVGVVRERATKGSAVTAGERILLFVRSFLSTIALLTLLGVVAGAALSAALYASCAIHYPQSPDSEGAIQFAVVAALITAVAIYATIKWIQYKRRRWRRDIGESE